MRRNSSSVSTDSTGQQRQGARRTTLVPLAALAVVGLVLPVGAPPQVLSLPAAQAQIDGAQQGPRGGEWRSDADPAMSREDRMRIQEQEKRQRELEREEAYLQRLEDLGVGGNGGGSSSDSSGDASGDDDDESESSDSGSGRTPSGGANISEPVSGAGEEVKSGTGGPGPLDRTDVPKNAGVGAPNEVAWRAVEKAVALLTSGQTMTYGGVRPQPDTEQSGGVIDCSGLILIAYGTAGIAVGGVASGQKYPGNPIKPTTPGAPSNPDTSKTFQKIENEKDALPGDIYIWGDGAGAGSHVSMVIAKDGDTAITQDYGGGPLIQTPGDGSSDDRSFAGIFRPTVMEDGSPSIPEADPEKSDSGSDSDNDDGEDEDG